MTRPQLPLAAAPMAPLRRADCEAQWQSAGYATLPNLVTAAVSGGGSRDEITARLRDLAQAYNGANANREALRRATDDAATLTEDWMDLQQIPLAPCRPITGRTAMRLEADLLADPQGFLGKNSLYPASSADKHWGFDTGFIADLLARSVPRLRQMREERQSDTAVLVGNGPSLNASNLDLLSGHEVYLSNYAIRHPRLGPLARGLAISNYFVAAQEPQLFHPALPPSPPWRLYPVWLSHVLPDHPQTIWLPAMGGEIFFSKDIGTRIAWHATVSYFWLQALLALGYRKVVMIGFDHSYQQPAGLGEGVVLEQTEDDPNHFDKSYFRGRKWQSADVDHMAQGYLLAKAAYEAQGCEIVNCTEGGKLEVFRRGALAQELRG